MCFLFPGWQMPLHFMASDKNTTLSAALNTNVLVEEQNGVSGVEGLK